MEDTERKLRVFLCHAKDDKPTVRGLYRQLTAEGWLDIWLDETKLLPGQEWDLEIERAVEQSDVVVVCLSNRSVEKEGYVQKELRFVLNIADEKPDGTIFVIPLRLDNCIIPRRIRGWQYTDYFPVSERSDAYLSLLASLRLRANSLGLELGKSEAHSSVEKKGGVPVPIKIASQTILPSETQSSNVSLVPSNSVTYSAASLMASRQDFIGMEFVKIPAGIFLMGSSDDDPFEYEKPQHTVELNYDYFIGHFPITNEQFATYAKVRGIKHPIENWESRRSHPVVNISWNLATEYCQWLNGVNKKVLPPGLMFRLPTEAEWEKAARGTDGRVWPWGNVFDIKKCNASLNAWISFAKIFLGIRTTPVGKYSPKGDSPFGLTDTAGNVWEWTHSLFMEYPYKVDDGRESEQTGGARIMRGGSFFNEGWAVRCTTRFWYEPSYFYENIGFRVVVAPPLPQSTSL